MHQHSLEWPGGANVPMHPLYPPLHVGSKLNKKKVSKYFKHYLYRMCIKQTYFSLDESNLIYCQNFELYLSNILCKFREFYRLFISQASFIHKYQTCPASIMYIRVMCPNFGHPVLTSSFTKCQF